MREITAFHPTHTTDCSSDFTSCQRGQATAHLPFPSSPSIPFPVSDHARIFAKANLDAASGASLEGHIPSPSTPVSPETGQPATAGRLVALDALRGFDMFWIVGAGAVIQSLDKMCGTPFTTALAFQFKHVHWKGLHCYDVIFPLFLFIIGISIVFSLDKALAAGGRAQVLARVLRRSVLLFALGVFYYGGFVKPWPNVQLGGVLPRIALCYLAAALIYTFIQSTRGLLAAAAALLIGYWALLTFVPFPDLSLHKPVVEEIAQRIGSDSPAAIAAAVPERVHGVYEEYRNLANYVDFLYMPGRKAQIYFINEGLLSTIPSIAISLFGAAAGLLLKNRQVPPLRKIAWLAGAGVALIVVGRIWAIEFPLIKRIWTSSFVVVATGWSALMLALFYYVVDVKQWRKWCQPFVWIGCNALTVYVAAQVLNFDTMAERFAGGDVQDFLDTHIASGCGDLVIDLTSLLIAVFFARFLYQRKIFLRV
jgi:predicted acyltransferase